MGIDPILHICGEGEIVVEEGLCEGFIWGLIKFHNCLFVSMLFHYLSDLLCLNLVVKSVDFIHLIHLLLLQIHEFLENHRILLLELFYLLAHFVVHCL